MSYHSLGFLLFSACVVLVYYLLGRKRQRWVLAAANLCFYTAAGIKYLPFLLTTMLATYFSGRAMGNIYDRSDVAVKACANAAERKQVKADARQKAKRALQAGMLVSIALLGVCKYTAFILTNLNAVTGLFSLPQLPVFRLILPLGISFYTFMALSYVLDVYWRRYPAEKNFLNYAVYLSYFPHVVQGPIDRFNEFRDQIRDGVAFDTKNLVFGAELAVWGFFKKLVIADRLDPFVSHVFDHWAECSGLILFLAVMAYSVQIYADFSGCIDIVSGISEMLGIRLRKNFNHPYFSKTMAEFWRRWHISLQEWFKDYLFYPVFSSDMMRKTKKSLNEKGRARAAELFSSCFPILVVWLTTGFWHGASWNYVVWGLFHASLLISSQILGPVFKASGEKLHVSDKNALWRFCQMLRTFLLCGLGRIFFRAADVKSAFGYLGRLFSHAFDKVVFSKAFTSAAGAVLSQLRSFAPKKFLLALMKAMNKDIGYNITLANVTMSLIVIFVLWIVDLLQERGCIREDLAKRNIIIRWTIVFAGLFSVIIFGIYGPGYDATKFIYEKY